MGRTGSLQHPTPHATTTSRGRAPPLMLHYHCWSGLSSPVPPTKLPALPASYCARSHTCVHPQRATSSFLLNKKLSSLSPAAGGNQPKLTTAKPKKRGPRPPPKPRFAKKHHRQTLPHATSAAALKTSPLLLPPREPLYEARGAVGEEDPLVGPVPQDLAVHLEVPRHGDQPCYIYKGV
jgi:hypothetical protein